MDLRCGDRIRYRAVHVGEGPHHAVVQEVRPDGVIVLDDPPGPPFTHLVYWDRILVTAEEFEAQYAARSGITVEQLRAAGRVVIACYCGGRDCQGWESTRPCKCGRAELHLAAPGCDGVGFTDHVTESEGD